MKVFNLAVIGLTNCNAFFLYIQIQVLPKYSFQQRTSLPLSRISLCEHNDRRRATSRIRLKKRKKNVTQRVESCVFNNRLLEFFHGCRIFQETIVTHNTIDYFPTPYTEQVKTTRQQTNDTTGVESSRNQNYVFDEFKYRGQRLQEKMPIHRRKMKYILIQYRIYY